MMNPNDRNLGNTKNLKSSYSTALHGVYIERSRRSLRAIIQEQKNNNLSWSANMTASWKEGRNENQVHLSKKRPLLNHAGSVLLLCLPLAEEAKP